ncbi:lectin protein kinase family protein [Striga asiatica]|uniref:Receptor-like serine/threonine-protein kinase n=1 Tax=Striga asiatica TaxID=4170 RepID=A0A5A7R063_STRAF|nr:lectin protein kinase family protein [Striga asiatica]
MWLSWLNHLLLGERLRKCDLTRYTWLPLMLQFLCCAFSGVSCDDFAIPLGSEINNAFDSGKNQNWVSKNGVFSLGFLVMDGGDEYAVGLKYNLGDKSANLPVWTIGGSLRIPQNSILRLAMDGELVLVNNPSKITMWSSGTSNLGVQKAKVLDNGNFVLLGSKNEVVWESFDSPTNTLLPGQSFRYPQTLCALSSKSISSYYSLVISKSGELRLEWEYNVTYWSSQFTSKEARFDSKGVFGLYNAENKDVWLATAKDYGDPSVTLRHLRIDRDGNLRIYSWDKMGRAWKPVWQAVEDQCSVFGSCGLYSVCGYNSTGPVCDCLNPIPLGGAGCLKLADLGNCRLHASLLTLNQTVLYGLYPSHDNEMLLSQMRCRDFCLRDSACLAATSMNDGSGLCKVKRTSFVSGYKGPSVRAVSFLKVCSVPQAVAAARGLGGGGPTASARDQVSTKGSSKRLIWPVMFVVLVTLLVVSSIQIVILTVLYRKRNGFVRKGNPEAARADGLYSVLVRVSFEEVKELTNGFADKIGGSVFRGALPNGTPIVAKVLTDVGVSEREFRAAVASLSGTHHRNLASVKGFCFEGSSKKALLIREFVCNESLDKWVGAEENHDGGRNWERKVEIALSVARGLAYLHSECQKCITHGNLKMENVVFDENMVPKLTDFGLRDLYSRQVQVQAASSSESASERDIYALGLMFVQILTCKREVYGENMESVVEEVKRKRKFLDGDGLEAIERMARISFWCMQSQPFLRPSIGEVVKVLEGTLSVDRPPSFLVCRRDDVKVDTEMLEA